MRRITALILYAFFAKRFSDAHNIHDKLPLTLVDGLSGTLFDRALRAPTFRYVDMDNTTLGKPASVESPQRFSAPLRSSSQLQHQIPIVRRIPVVRSSPSTELWPLDKVRSTFIDFYKDKEHEFVKSSPVVPLNDPTLLFANAGMNQFKPIFLGVVEPGTSLEGLKRAANAQKCIRAGGKHNDLEDVGRDTYHHTFFEMLGTWSFGDYFKKESIDWGWDLLTKQYGLEKDRLYATYFEGTDEVPADTEARDYWLQYLPESHVIACGYKDNFWEMGDTGPCGPSSEIHYDRIGGRNAAELVNKDDPNVLEIWNHVFMQFNRDPERGLVPLPQKHIDTGMGLERLASILQQKTSNYDTDAFTPLFEKIAEHSKIGPYQGKVGADDTDLRDTAYRAIADHARSLCFAIADGAVPDKDGRGYVLRRILRRATRYGREILKAEPGFFETLVPVVVEHFGKAYPELVEKQGLISEIIKEEEASFASMLDRGIKYFGKLSADLKLAGKNSVSGEQAFFLYDTLGFPLDLTELMSEEVGLKVDAAGFAKEMEAKSVRDRQITKALRSGGAGQLTFTAEQTAWLTDHGVPPTDDSFKYKLDVEVPATVLAVFGNSGFVEKGSAVGKDELVGIVLDKSSFYAEAGGQETDLGSIDISSSDGSLQGRFIVSDVQSYGAFVLHLGVMESGQIEVGDGANCKVDYNRRRLIIPNHSMTHILNAALRKVLGDKVEQRGSFNNHEKLRFDFAHKKAMTADQVRATEEYCQKAIVDATPVTTRLVPLKEAMAIEGVQAIFGEKYPDPVRVVFMMNNASVEFCGGTHVSNTAEAEACVLVEETSVAKGVRRITAVTKNAAKEAIAEGAKFKTMVADCEKLDASTPDLSKQALAIKESLDTVSVSAVLKSELRKRIEEIQKKAQKSQKALLALRIDHCLNQTKKGVEAALENNKKVLVLNLDLGGDSKSSTKIINLVQQLAPELAFLATSEEEPGSGGKVIAFAAVPNALVEQGFKANEWVKAALESCGGKSGGRPTSAQGQAKDCSDVKAVTAAANAFADAALHAQV